MHTQSTHRVALGVQLELLPQGKGGEQAAEGSQVSHERGPVQRAAFLTAAQPLPLGCAVIVPTFGCMRDEGIEILSGPGGGGAGGGVGPAFAGGGRRWRVRNG